MHGLCRLIGHRRNKRRITQWRESWQTECLMCSLRLIRVRPGEWVPISSIEKQHIGLAVRRTNFGD